MTQRAVVLLCGPPGAGKTTEARRSGLTVFDRDDDRWSGERQFRLAISGLVADAAARAVVIRSGATVSARKKARALIGATHCFVLIEDPRELRRRIEARGRSGRRQQQIAVKAWFDRFEDHGVARFEGWGFLDAPLDLDW